MAFGPRRRKWVLYWVMISAMGLKVSGQMVNGLSNAHFSRHAGAKKVKRL
jgi:hypothetical protein